MRTTHTFVELEISSDAYLEIYGLLAGAGYHHAFIDCDRVIDMHGIALTRKERAECTTAQYGATCFDVIEDAQSDLASPNNDRYDPEARARILRGEKVCDYCRAESSSMLQVEQIVTQP